MGFPDGSMVKNPPANAGDMGSVPGSGRSPGEGKVKEIPRVSKLQKSLHVFGYLFDIVFPKNLTGTYLFS